MPAASATSRRAVSAIPARARVVDSWPVLVCAPVCTLPPPVAPPRCLTTRRPASRCLPARLAQVGHSTIDPEAMALAPEGRGALSFSLGVVRSECQRSCIVFVARPAAGAGWPVCRGARAYGACGHAAGRRLWPTAGRHPVHPPASTLLLPSPASAAGMSADIQQGMHRQVGILPCCDVAASLRVLPGCQMQQQRQQRAR